MSFQPIQRLQGLRVLVVDDNDDACKLVSLILETYQVEVTTVNSVQEALSRFEALQPDLIISDIAMPQEDGYSLLSQIRARSNHKLPPAIAMTAYQVEEDDQTIRAAGFQFCLTKPIDPEQLITAIVTLNSIDKTVHHANP
ncbi:response regulator [Egbenema bharatensis]|uniref:response regulator n=1 Tax=Egbenema bharatensis TaxID=3463334 RepID=UPI003A84460B